MLYPYDTKTLKAEIKNVDEDKGIIEGYFSSFGNKDSDGDIIKKGAYKRTIDHKGPGGSNRIMHLLQHDPTKPLGKPSMLKEDDFGLLFRTKVSDTSYGKDALKLYKDGVFNEHSVGINIVKSTWSDQDEANIVTEVKMWEGSTVTWGANEMTPVIGMKSEGDQDLIERYDTLSKAFYRGDYTDETFEVIEKQKDFLEQQIRKALEDHDPSSDTHVDIQPADIKEAFNTFNLKQTIRGTFYEFK